MPFFRIIIPNYNNAEWIDKCLRSVKNQAFTDYEVAFVDDQSTDSSLDLARGIANGDRRIKILEAPKKLYNGGARNYGLEEVDGQYTLFLDSDDWFVDNGVLQLLHDFIEDHYFPDCIRLPYRFEYDGNKDGQVPLCDDTTEKLARSIFVACWTKCIKSELVQPFPENTLMEDVVQHIKQCDMITDCVPFNHMMVLHNRNNLNSCTRKENQDCQHGKWQSSMYRYMADLLDLELTHDYCISERDKRAKVCLENIKAGKYIQ